jgi:AcrR family transcriptional regulator
VAAAAYTRLRVEERRRQVIAAGSALFADHAFEDITMRRIAQAAGISKALLYHYFPSKTDLFIAAVGAHAEELERLLEPAGGHGPIEELATSLDAYLTWIEAHGRMWSKLMQSATTVPAVRDIADAFRERTLRRLLGGLTGAREPPPALRIALRGWLGGADAAILDWVRHRDIARDQLRDLLVAAFAAAVAAAGPAGEDVHLPDDRPLSARRGPS